MRALFWNTFPGTLIPSAPPLCQVYSQTRCECFTLHTAECPPGSHTLLSHQLELSPAANTTSRRGRYYSDTGRVSATGWVLHLNKKLYWWGCSFCTEDARVIQNLLKSLQSDDCCRILVKFHSTWRFHLDIFYLIQTAKLYIHLTVNYLVSIATYHIGELTKKQRSV